MNTIMSGSDRKGLWLFKRQNPHKAAGPDPASPSALKHCADQLSMVFTDTITLHWRHTMCQPASKSPLSSPSPKKQTP